MIIFLIWISYDRFKVTFSRTKLHHLIKVSSLDYLVSYLIIILYIFIACISIYFTIRHIFIGRSSIFMLIGATIFLIARQLRVYAILCLGKNWTIYSSNKYTYRVMKIGPYKYSRHPYYIATFFELLGFVVIGESKNALIILLFGFVPLLLFRILYEEVNLLKKFDIKYRQYMNSTSRFFSVKKFLKEKIKNVQSFQFFYLIRHYGFKHLFNMAYVNKNIITHVRGYMLSSCLGALSEIGFFEEVQKNNKVNLDKFSRCNQLNFYYLKAICDYLFILGFLTREKGNYFLSEKGTKLIKRARGAYDLLYAYFPIFENLVPLLRGQKCYGKDFFRRGKYVAKGTAELALYLPFPESVAIFKKYYVNSVLDLACGSADFLISICSQSKIRGIGIDISDDAVRYAQERVKEANLDKQIKIVVGDMFNLKTLPADFKEVDAISIMFALHEFLYEDSEKVIKFLNQIKSIFPNRYLLIIELLHQSAKKLQLNPSGIVEHHLFHAVSKQGFAKISLWHSLFEISKLKLVEEKIFDFAGQGYFLLKT